VLSLQDLVNQLPAKVALRDYNVGAVVVTSGSSSWNTTTKRYGGRARCEELMAQLHATYGFTFNVVAERHSAWLSAMVKKYKGLFIVAKNTAEIKHAVCRTIPEYMGGKSVGVDPVQPVASFSASPLQSVMGQSIDVTFTNTSTGNADDVYSWSFGDGTFSTTKNPVHSYTREGQYSVILKVTTRFYGDNNDQTLSDLETKTNYLLFADKAPPPVVNFAADSTAGDLPPSGVGYTVTFSNLTTGQYTNVLWNFGDGASSTALNPTHRYTKEGSYTVSLKAWNTTPLIGGGSNTKSVADYIKTWDCAYPNIIVDLSVTIIEKCPFSFDLMIGVIPIELTYSFSWSECELPYVCSTQPIPQGLKPIAILGLKYTAITGEGKTSSPYKVGQNLFWSSSGFLSYEIVKNIDGNAVRLCFNSEIAFPGPVNRRIIISPTANNFVFNKTNNVLGIQGNDYIIRLIEFEVYDKESLQTSQSFQSNYNGSTVYTTIEVCDVINNVFNKDIIAIPDKFGRVNLISTSDNGISIVAKEQGSTANEVFGFSEYGCVGIPDNSTTDIEYEVTLYLAAVLQDTNMDSDVMNDIQKLVGPYRAVIGEFEIKSSNYYQLLYGDPPRTIKNNVYLPAGHRYVAQSNVMLKSIDESTTLPTMGNSRYATTGFIDIESCPNTESSVDLTTWSPAKARAASLASPYWRGMVCDSQHYMKGNFLWMPGDDNRFYSKRIINAANNSIEIQGNYKFMAPGPVIKNEITAKNIGPYNLPLEPAKRRFLCIRRISVAGDQKSFTLTEGTSTSVSVDWSEYSASTQTLTIYSYRVPNVKKPKNETILNIIPDMRWTNGDTVETVGVWEGLGTSEISCVINPSGHSSSEIKVYVWLDYNDETVSQSEDWHYIELPFGENVTATEIIKAMQRDGDWLRTNNSNCHWTPSTSRLNDNQFLEAITTPSGGRSYVQLGYEFLDVDGRLRIRTSTDYDYRIRLGGSPEACYANKVFGWDILGELGDSSHLPQGPFYTYKYAIEAYATKNLHPSLGANNIVNEYVAREFSYKLIYNADKISMYDDNGNVAREQYEWVECGGTLVKAAYDRSLYINILQFILKSYYECLLSELPGGVVLPPIGTIPDIFDDNETYNVGDEIENPIGGRGYISVVDNNTDPLSSDNWVPKINSGPEYPFTIDACTECVTLTEITVPINCTFTGDCADLATYGSVNFNSANVNDLITAWGTDPFLSIILTSINLALLNGSSIDRTYTNIINNTFTTILNDSIEISLYTSTTEVSSEFSILSISSDLETLRLSILNNIFIDPLQMIHDMAVFTVTYVENFNSIGDVEGVSYIQSKISTLQKTFRKFTIAPLSLVTLAIGVIHEKVNTTICTQTIDLDCDTDIFHTIYPILFDAYTGIEVVPYSIKIELCYCSYDAGAKNQLTICLPNSKNMNPTIGVIKKVTNSGTYLERTETFDLIDSTGMVYTHTISWDADAMPMGIEANPDSTGVGDPSLIKSVEWSPINEEMTIELCPAAIEQYQIVSSSCDDCVVLPGSLSYTFISDAIPSGSTSIVIDGTQIMREDFIVLLKTNLQNLDVEVDVNGIIMVSSISDSVTVVAPTGDPFNFMNDEVITEQNEIEVVIYYTYLEKESTKIPKDVYIAG